MRARLWAETKLMQWSPCVQGCLARNGASWVTSVKVPRPVQGRAVDEEEGVQRLWQVSACISEPSEGDPWGHRQDSVVYKNCLSAWFTSVCFPSEQSAFRLKTRQHINKLIESTGTKILVSFHKFEVLASSQGRGNIRRSQALSAKNTVTLNLIGWKGGDGYVEKLTKGQCHLNPPSHREAVLLSKENTYTFTLTHMYTHTHTHTHSWRFDWMSGTCL